MVCRHSAAANRVLRLLCRGLRLRLRLLAILIAPKAAAALPVKVCELLRRAATHWRRVPSAQRRAPPRRARRRRESLQAGTTCRPDRPEMRLPFALPPPNPRAPSLSIASSHFYPASACSTPPFPPRPHSLPPSLPLPPSLQREPRPRSAACAGALSLAASRRRLTQISFTTVSSIVVKLRRGAGARTCLQSSFLMFCEHYNAKLLLLRKNNAITQNY